MEEYRTIPMPVEVQDKQCPKCKWNLAFALAKLDIFPYLHVDLVLKCLNCQEEYRFGVPFDHEAGMSQYIFGTDYQNAGAAFRHAGNKRCPFCIEAMPMTKYIYYDTEKDPVIQHKCPHCYFLQNEAVTDIVTGGLIVDEATKQRLTALGYIEPEAEDKK